MKKSDPEVLLAKKIARAIFDRGRMGIGPVGRIQFMHGKWPNDRPGGGLNERALQSEITDVLRKLAKK